MNGRSAVRSVGPRRLTYTRAPMSPARQGLSLIRKIHLRAWRVCTLLSFKISTPSSVMGGFAEVSRSPIRVDTQLVGWFVVKRVDSGGEEEALKQAESTGGGGST